jgi:hypothetical protein
LPDDRIPARPFADAAHTFAERGLPVFPIRPGFKQRPLTKWRHGPPGQRATTDLEQVARWAKRWGSANIGVPTGADSGIYVLDIDVGGEVPAWARPTLAVRTASGGLHLWYRLDRPAEVRNSAGAIAPHVDVRGEGGMVVAPPSILDSEDGQGVYSWIDAGVPIAEIDPDLLMQDNRPEATGRSSNGNRRYVPREVVRKGERHDELLRCAGSLEAQGVPYHEAEAFLRDLNESFLPPMEGGELERELDGILAYVYGVQV